MRILCVDDDPLWLGLLKEMVLEVAGPEAALMSSLTGTQAIRIAERNPVDIALIDITLCDMSGYAVMKRLRELNPATRLIALTGWGQLSTVSEAKAKGAAYCLFKPVSLTTLADTLANCGVENRIATDHPAANVA
jgi:DNA-binding NtrC family response regulator